MKLFDGIAVDLLRQTSRTFFIPIMRLPSELRAAVGSAYLCMRAIDEIEDHPDLDPADKQNLLESVSEILQGAQDGSQLDALAQLFAPFGDQLPSVTRRLN